MLDNGPVTLAAMAASGTLLLVWCDCGHHAELRPEKLGLPLSTPVPGIEGRLRCSACGARNTATRHPVRALMDPRQNGVTGAYPAFR